MTRQFSCAIAMSPLEQIVPLAQTAEECGFTSIALPDSLFYSETVSADYPYTQDGSRMWTAETPWPDPLIAAGAIGAATSTIRSYTQVLKLGSRNPLLLARQLLTVAAITQNRFGFGVGIGWSPEEFAWCGQPYEKRGKRVDEMIEVIKLVLGGGMVEHHGEFYDFDKLQMSPAPTEPMPIYVGGHTEVALKRAARIGDGWTSAMIKFDDLVATIKRLGELRAEYGRDDRSVRDPGRVHRPVRRGRLPASSSRQASPTSSPSRGCSTASASTASSKPSRTASAVLPTRS